MLANYLSLEIAGVVVSAVSQGGKLFRVPGAYLAFASEHEPDLQIAVRYGHVPPQQDPEQLVFDSGLFWTLGRSEKGWVWRYHSIEDPSQITMLGLYSPDYRSGDLYLEIPASGREGGLFPLNYPIDRFLYTTLLADRNGLLLHACGVDLDGHGLLFAGPSGAGKSTMAELWNQGSDPTILSDERVAVSGFAGRPWLYGTPWFGTAGLSSPKRARLEAVFLLSQGPKNQVVPLSPSQALRRLTPCVFWPFWSRTGMETGLQVVQSIVRQVPCFDLIFVPTLDVIELLEEKMPWSCTEKA